MNICNLENFECFNDFMFCEVFCNYDLIYIIKSFLPVKIPDTINKYPELDLPGIYLEGLDEDDFFIYCCFKFGYQHLLKPGVRASTDLLDSIANENQSEMFNLIYTHSVQPFIDMPPLYCHMPYVTTDVAIYGAFKHKNINILKKILQLKIHYYQLDNTLIFNLLNKAVSYHAGHEIFNYLLSLTNEDYDNIICKYQVEDLINNIIENREPSYIFKLMDSTYLSSLLHINQSSFSYWNYLIHDKISSISRNIILPFNPISTYYWYTDQFSQNPDLMNLIIKKIDSLEDKNSICQFYHDLTLLYRRYKNRISISSSLVYLLTVAYRNYEFQLDNYGDERNNANKMMDFVIMKQILEVIKNNLL